MLIPHQPGVGGSDEDGPAGSESTQKKFEDAERRKQALKVTQVGKRESHTRKSGNSTTSGSKKFKGMQMSGSCPNGGVFFNTRLRGMSATGTATQVNHQGSAAKEPQSYSMGRRTLPA